MRAAGLDFALSKIVAAIFVGTGSNRNGSIEYAARPFDSVADDPRHTRCDLLGDSKDAACFRHTFEAKETAWVPPNR